MARFDLTGFEWSVIQPLLPTKVRGVKRVDDRRVLNGIFWRLRTGAPWADIPSRYGPHTTCMNRFNRWRRAGVWKRILDAVSEAYDGHSAYTMLDSLTPVPVLLADRAYDADKLRAACRQYSAYAPARPATRLQSGPLSMSQPDRALLQHTQAFQGRCHPIRQTRRQFPRLRTTRLNKDMAEA